MKTVTLLELLANSTHHHNIPLQAHLDNQPLSVQTAFETKNMTLLRDYLSYNKKLAHMTRVVQN